MTNTRIGQKINQLEKVFSKVTAELKKLKLEKMSVVEKAKVDHTGHLVEELLSQVLMKAIMVMNMVVSLMIVLLFNVPK